MRLASEVVLDPYGSRKKFEKNGRMA